MSNVKFAVVVDEGCEGALEFGFVAFIFPNVSCLSGKSVGRWRSKEQGLNAMDGIGDGSADVR